MLCICILCMFLEKNRKGWHSFFGSTKQFHSKLNDDVEVNGWMANVVANEMWTCIEAKIQVNTLDMELDHRKSTMNSILGRYSLHSRNYIYAHIMYVYVYTNESTVNISHCVN